jgi:hypothetical protein
MTQHARSLTHAFYADCCYLETCAVGPDSCGGNDKPCCNGNTCQAGLTCQVVFRDDTGENLCKDPACGEDGEPCCQGDIPCLTFPGSRCTDGKCEKIECFTEGKECCPPIGPVPPDFTGCEQGLTCSQDNRCVASGGSTCGANDQDCCGNENGSESCKDGLECTQYIVTDIARLVCKTPGCGVTGGPCCDGTIKCRNENTDSCNGHGKCETIDCGGEGKVCCNANGLPPPDFTGCENGLKCVDGQCKKSGGGGNDCGANDQRCCDSEKCEAGFECVDYTIGDTIRRVCKAGGCGETGGPCCDGGIECLQGNLDRCTGGKCQKIDCGEEGEECCPPNGKPGPDFTGCQKSLKCVQDKCTKQAAPCGRIKQKCCKGRKCRLHLRCRKGFCVRGRVY